MGSTITFSTTDGTASGYLASPAAGTGIPVIVIQEWWGVIPQIERTCDRLAEAGFMALAPDLYEGTRVPLSEPDEAAKAMMGLELRRAAAELSGAVDELLARSGHAKVGVIGFCMGGGLALVLATTRADAVGATVACYGVHPWAELHPDLDALAGPVQIHCADHDDFFTAAAADELAARLEGLGKVVDLHHYADADHAFFNEDRPEVYREGDARVLLDRSVAFLGGALS